MPEKIGNRTHVLHVAEIMSVMCTQFILSASMLFVSGCIHFIPLSLVLKSLKCVKIILWSWKTITKSLFQIWLNLLFTNDTLFNVFLLILNFKENIALLSFFKHARNLVSYLDTNFCDLENSNSHAHNVVAVSNYFEHCS